jgi:L-ascorbate metabolism protein UlaG (beta-lactamase superfamily)
MRRFERKSLYCALLVALRFIEPTANLGRLSPKASQWPEELLIPESRCAIHHPIVMALLPAECNGGRYVNPVPTKLGGFSLMFKLAPRFFFGAAKRSPSRTPGPFHTDPRVYATSPKSGLRITWLGHSSSLVEIDGVRILIDPIWDQRAGPVEWAGPKRFFPSPLAIEDLPAIDAVLISHDHYDHLGARTVKRLAQMAGLRQARWITALGVGEILRSLGVDPNCCTELNWTENVKVGSVNITALPARHFSGRSLWGRFKTLWASFAFTGSEHRVYYGADSGEWYGFQDIGESFGPFDLTMLEIGAFDPLWADIHMGPEGAVRSFRALGGHGLLMPVHWGLFDLALHPWKQPIENVSSVEGLKLWSPEPGAPSEVIQGEEIRSEWWRKSESEPKLTHPE